MTEASTGTGSPSRTALPSGPVWRAGLLAALAASVVNALAWVLVQQVLDAGLQIPAQPGSTDLNALPRGPVVRTDPATDRVTAAVPRDGLPTALAADGDLAWVATTSPNAVLRLPA